MQDIIDDDYLYEMFAKLKTKEDVKNFLEDLCTIKEIKDMSNRLKAAKLLSKGETYTDVTKKTGVSSATLARINRCLNYGSGGYNKVLK